MPGSNIQSGTNQTQQTVTFTIALNEEASLYLEQQGVTEPNEYINQLIKEEQKRQNASGPGEVDQPPPEAQELLNSTPDASGYPKQEKHFYS